MEKEKPVKFSPFLPRLRDAKGVKSEEESWRWKEEQEAKYGKNCIRIVEDSETRVKVMQGKGFEVVPDVVAPYAGAVVMIRPNRKENERSLEEREKKLRDLEAAHTIGGKRDRYPGVKSGIRTKEKARIPEIMR